MDKFPHYTLWSVNDELIFLFSCCVVITKLSNSSCSSILLILHSDDSNDDDDDDEDDKEAEEKDDEDKSEINMLFLPSLIPPFLVERVLQHSWTHTMQLYESASGVVPSQMMYSTCKLTW